MPDQFGFDHLGASATVRCIDCPTGGPIWRWPEPKRHRHARTHRVPHLNTAPLRRQRILLAAPPTNNNEEKKEAITMARTKAKKGESAKAVALDLLRKAGGPLAAKEIAKQVINSGRCAGLKGKTPEATISAMLAVGSRPGGPFARVDKGTYALPDTASTSAKKTELQTAAVTKPVRTRETAPAAKATSRTRTKRPAAKRTR
jgi:HB1, ASXL, restriction endonuclease HTH domain